MEGTGSCNRNRFAMLGDLLVAEPDYVAYAVPATTKDNVHGKKTKVKELEGKVGALSVSCAPPQQPIRKDQEFKAHWAKLEQELSNLPTTKIRERLVWLKLQAPKSNRRSQLRVLLPKYKKFCEKIFSERSNMARHFRNNMTRGHRNAYHFDYLVVIDFEATCDIQNPEDFQHEIIQFPAVLIDVHRQEIVDEFNSYCKPRVQPRLSDFCISLTGISQETIDSARDFSDVLDDFKQWLISHELGTKYKFSLVADGFCDMGKFLYTQCALSGLEYPAFAFQWVDIRLLFFHFYGIKWYKLPVTLELLGERLHGTLHNGLDDSKNIGAILLRMIRGGANPIQNERILLDLHEQEKNPPVHKYDLKTVKYIQPREFLGVQQEGKAYSSAPRTRTWNPHYHQQHAQEVTFNKENWYNVRFGTGTGIPPANSPVYHPSPPPPVRRVNKLKIALRNACRDYTEEESASPKLDNVVPKPINKVEQPTNPIVIVK